MATPQRPLSPHLQVYRPQITTVLSIVHRITGVILAFGAFGLALWLLALSGSEAHEGGHYFVPEDYNFDAIMRLSVSVPGRIIVAGFSWCLIYHLLNGIRHLFWDAGKGFEIKQFTASGWVVVVFSLLLTAGLWAFAISHSGGMP
jgi:succinate dehydrogenase / fumarate reductase cytochrome b subunit